MMVYFDSVRGERKERHMQQQARIRMMIQVSTVRTYPYQSPYPHVIFMDQPSTGCCSRQKIKKNWMLQRRQSTITAGPYPNQAPASGSGATPTGSNEPVVYSATCFHGCLQNNWPLKIAHAVAATVYIRLACHLPSPSTHQTLQKRHIFELQV